jgi:hypothetical protein
MAKRRQVQTVRLRVPHAPNRDEGAPVRLVALGISVPVGEWFELRQDRAAEALRIYPWLEVEDLSSEAPAQSAGRKAVI